MSDDHKLSGEVFDLIKGRFPSAELLEVTVTERERTADGLLRRRLLITMNLIEPQPDPFRPPSVP